MVTLLCSSRSSDSMCLFPHDGKGGAGVNQQQRGRVANSPEQKSHSWTVHPAKPAPPALQCVSVVCSRILWPSPEEARGADRQMEVTCGANQTRVGAVISGSACHSQGSRLGAGIDLLARGKIVKDDDNESVKIVQPQKDLETLYFASKGLAAVLSLCRVRVPIAVRCGVH